MLSLHSSHPKSDLALCFVEGILCPAVGGTASFPQMVSPAALTRPSLGETSEGFFGMRSDVYLGTSWGVVVFIVHRTKQTSAPSYVYIYI